MKEPDTLWNKLGWLVFSIIGGLILALYFQSKEIKKLRYIKPEIKPCKCLTIEQILFHVEKREMFVDKLQRTSRKQRSAIIDSINFHNSILDSTGNVIEY